MEIQEQKMFICPETGKLFKTKKAAEISAEKAIKLKKEQAETKRLAEISNEEKKKQQNYVRLNLSKIDDLPNMLIEKGREFFGLEITGLQISVSFGNVSNSHSCPISGEVNWDRKKDKPLSYLGWYGQISFLCRAKYNPNRFGATDLLFNKYNDGFIGFYDSCGCPGSTSGEYKAEMSFSFFLDDFPILKEKYERYIKEQEKIDANNQAIESLDDAAEQYAKYHQDILELERQILVLENLKYAKIQDLREYYKNHHPAVILPISEDYQKLKQDLKG